MRIFSCKSRIVEPNVQQTNLEAVIADKIDELVSLGCYRLLAEEHEQAIEPLGRGADGLGSESQQDHLLGRFVGRTTAVTSLNISGVISRWGITVDSDLGGRNRMRRAL